MANRIAYGSVANALLDNFKDHYIPTGTILTMTGARNTTSIDVTKERLNKILIVEGYKLIPIKSYGFKLHNTALGPFVDGSTPQNILWSNSMEIAVALRTELDLIEFKNEVMKTHLERTGEKIKIKEGVISIDTDVYKFIIN